MRTAGQAYDRTIGTGIRPEKIANTQIIALVLAASILVLYSSSSVLHDLTVSEEPLNIDPALSRWESMQKMLETQKPQTIPVGNYGPVNYHSVGTKKNEEQVHTNRPSHHLLSEAPGVNTTVVSVALLPELPSSPGTKDEVSIIKGNQIHNPDKNLPTHIQAGPYKAISNSKSLPQPDTLINASYLSGERFRFGKTAEWKCPCGSANYTLPIVLIKQIQKQLMRWQEGKLSEKAIDFMAQMNKRSYHFSSIDGLLTGRFDPRIQKTVYFKRLVQFMAETNKACAGLPNGEFVLTHDDHPKVLHQDSIPIMAPITTKLHADISFPYMYTFKNEQSEWKKVMWGKPLPSTLNNCPQWDQRKKLVFFRGGCTGPTTGYKGPLWRYYNRQRFSRLAKKHPDLLSGGMTDLCDELKKNPWKSEIEKEGSEIKLVGMPVMCNYRHLLQLDGNTASGRFPYLLWMGATIFKQDSPYTEHWYPLLEPWKNFVPVANSLEDLVEKAEWALANPEKAKAIADNGKVLAEKHLNLVRTSDDKKILIVVPSTF